MNNVAKVSIGLITYNGAKHLKHSIESILNQDYPNTEIIISDDKSTDETIDIINFYLEKEPRIKFLRNKENIGIVKNFEKVLAAGSGEFFMFASQDDLWDKQYITELVKALKKNDRFLLATPYTIYIDTKGRLIPERDDRPAIDGNSINNLQIYLEDYANCWYYGIYRKEELLKVFKWFKQYPAWGGDVLFISKLCLQCDLTGNNQARIYKRQGDNVSGLISPKKYFETMYFYIYMTFNLSYVSIVYTKKWSEKFKSFGFASKFIKKKYIKKIKKESKVQLRMIYKNLFKRVGSVKTNKK